MGDLAELRKRYRPWSRDVVRCQHLPFPEKCRDLRCGIRARAGTPCKHTEPPKLEVPYDPMVDPEFREILRRQGIPVQESAAMVSGICKPHEGTTKVDVESVSESPAN